MLKALKKIFGLDPAEQDTPLAPQPAAQAQRKAAEPQPGLTVIPDWDTELLERQKKSAVCVCSDCGTQWPPAGTCPNCGGMEKVLAVSC